MSFIIYSTITGSPKKTPNGAVIPRNYELNFGEKNGKEYQETYEKISLKPTYFSRATLCNYSTELLSM